LCGQTLQTRTHARTHGHEKEEGIKAFDGKGLLGRARRRWEDNIKMYFTEI
jgi:hypothetical protein